MLIVYKILVNALYVAVWPYLVMKHRRDPQEWNQRRVLNPRDYLPGGSGDCLWGHASSVGEVQVLRRLFAALQVKRPGLRFCISTYSRTGQAMARELFPEAVAVFYFPLDSYFCWRRFFRVFHPSGIVTVETELWPYLMDYCRRTHIPLVLANGRLTEKSFGRYRLFRGTLGRLLKSYRTFIMQTPDDAARIIGIGADPDRVVTAGNIKHDAASGDHDMKRREVRRQLGLPAETMLFIAASTRPGEEEILCRALRDVAAFPDKICCLMAPRHLDRLDEVKEILRRSELPFIPYSELEDGKGDSGPIILMDKMGLLAELLYGADLAFVGGTLADLGGHNVMEPVVAGVPVLFGPSLANVRQAADDILNRKCGMIVTDAESLSSALSQFASGDLSFAPYNGNGATVAADSAAMIIQELKL